ncbi:hypothetical protein ACFYUK_29530 [Nonomuraea wenchangensis]
MSVALGPGTQVRFRVREGDRLGSSWSILTVKGKGDVYVTHREAGHLLKTSFHESGQWHFSVTREGRTKLQKGESPYLGVVKEHAEIVSGWIHAMRITVARSELREGYNEQVRKKPTVEIPSRPEMDAVSIDLLLGTEQAAPLHIENAFPVAFMKRGDGGQVIVVARPMLLDEPIPIAMSARIEQVRRDLRQQGWDGTSLTRAVLIGHDENEGFHRQIEIAVDPDPS